MKYIYNTINDILGNESHITVITQILKCLCKFIYVQFHVHTCMSNFFLGTLIGATTFNSVLLPVIEKYLSHTRELMKHKDLTIRVACLSVVETFLGSNGISETSLLTVMGIDGKCVDGSNE